VIAVASAGALPRIEIEFQFTFPHIVWYNH
jgi:hypothetical protein